MRWTFDGRKARLNVTLKSRIICMKVSLMRHWHINPDIKFFINTSTGIHTIISVNFQIFCEILSMTFGGYNWQRKRCLDNYNWISEIIQLINKLLIFELKAL